jgi:hypothetical protein
MGSRAPSAFHAFNKAGAPLQRTGGAAAAAGGSSSPCLKGAGGRHSRRRSRPPAAAAAPRPPHPSDARGRGAPAPHPARPAAPPPPPAGKCSLPDGSPAAVSNATCGAVTIRALGVLDPSACPDKSAASFSPASCNYSGGQVAAHLRARRLRPRAPGLWSPRAGRRAARRRRGFWRGPSARALGSMPATPAQPPPRPRLALSPPARSDRGARRVRGRQRHLDQRDVRRHAGARVRRGGRRVAAARQLVAGGRHGHAGRGWAARGRGVLGPGVTVLYGRLLRGCGAEGGMDMLVVGGPPGAERLFEGARVSVLLEGRCFLHAARLRGARFADRGSRCAAPGEAA